MKEFLLLNYFTLVIFNIYKYFSFYFCDNHQSYESIIPKISIANH